MKVLGIGDGHGAGAVLIDDGRVLAAVSEERLSGRKRERGFPRRAIAWVLRETHVAPAELACVAYASLWGRSVTRFFDDAYRAGREGGGPTRWPARFHAAFENEVAQHPGVREIDARASRKLLEQRLAELDLGGRPLVAVEHHTAHALGAVLSAGTPRGDGGAGGPEREIALTLDGYGDGISGAAALVTRDERGAPVLRRYLSLPWEESLGLVYGAITEHLGFAEGDEGQVTAIAASGDPERCRAAFANLIPLRDVTEAGASPFTVDRKLLYGSLRKSLAGASPADVARALQDRVEDAVVRFAEVALGHSAAGPSVPTRLACSGGLFANVRLASRLAVLDGVTRVDVCPAMSDEGLALGAALAQSPSIAPDACESVAWGPEITGESAAKALERSGLRVIASDPEHALELAVEALADGAVVALADGRLEFGPRALGQRSLLFDARRPALAAHVSRALARPTHMPFAPATLADEAERCYLGLAALGRTARFMTAALATTDGFRASCPLAVHVDGSARAQLVTAASAPRLHALLARFRERTGVGTLVNTSLNLHGEPIVADADHALRTFLASGVDGLWLGGHWVRHPHPLH
ncbi:MAG: carbamoyltransferase C-terminal domain-containing protein [bacterium]